MDTLFNNLCQTLFELDPMGTCCKENDSYDEYNNIAAQTADLIDDGHSFSDALNRVLSDSFSEDMASQIEYEVIESHFKSLGS
jgi:hypothetical protein